MELKSDGICRSEEIPIRVLDVVCSEGIGNHVQVHAAAVWICARKKNVIVGRLYYA